MGPHLRRLLRVRGKAMPHCALMPVRRPCRCQQYLHPGAADRTVDSFAPILRRRRAMLTYHIKDDKLADVTSPTDQRRETPGCA